MQSASAALLNALNNGYDVQALPKIVVEWNQNRYAGIQEVGNSPAENNNPYIEEFPLESIIEPRRPDRGIIKARASKTITAPSVWKRQVLATGEEGFTTANYSDRPLAQRYYTVGAAAPYKYWSSHSPTLSTTNAQGTYDFPVGTVNPYVVYKTAAWTNKIVIGLENAWSSPTVHRVLITTDGTTWVVVSNNPTINAKGQIVLYRATDGSWNNNVNLGNPQQIRGVRYEVTTMNKVSSYLNLIEISARLERDLTEYLIEYSTDYTMSDSNFITPLGQASSNMASFSLSNFNQIFNNENTGSMYKGLIDKNAKVTLDLTYNLTESGAGFETIREFTMWIDDWSDDTQGEISAECKDSSKFYQEEPTSPILLENITIGEAIWRLCDLHGYTNYFYDKNDADASSIIPYFWTSEEDNVWSAFQKLAEATQTAVFFDEFDVLQIQTRNAAYNKLKPISWNLEATASNGKLADVESVESTGDYEANVVTINYKETKPSDDNRGFPEMQVLWEPEGDFVLRSSQLIENLSTVSTVLRMSPSETAVWPYDGMVNIEGELIRYRGKEYQYFNKSNAITKVYVFSLDEKKNIDDNLTFDNYQYRSTWTGNVKIEERGVYWSSPREHITDIAGWTGRVTNSGSSAIRLSQGGITHNRDQTIMRVSTGSSNYSEIYTVTKGQQTDAPYRTYGTSLRMPKNGQGRGMTGITICNGPGDQGYFIDLIRTEMLDANGGTLRNAHHELNFFVRQSNGALLRSGGIGGKGIPIIIPQDTWIDLDVDFEVDGTGAHNFTIRVNGVVRMRHTLTAGRVAVSGRFGVYCRGAQTTEFEYIYGFTGDPRVSAEGERADESTYFDRVRGGFSSTQFDREFTYGVKDANRRVGTKNVAYKQKYNQYLFDEFGPLVHEIREVELSFEKYPALHSRLYLTNDTQAVIPEYNATPFGVKFMLANASRDNAVLNGEDTLTFGADNAVTQKMMVYGRLISQAENQVYTIKNKTGKQENPVQDKDSIRRRGKVNVEIDSQWIQSKAAAESLGKWILENWADGCDELSVNVFGNPLFQIGDLVSVDYPIKNLFRSTHRYFVIGVKNTFDTGLSTNLVLRRAKI